MQALRSFLKAIAQTNRVSNLQLTEKHYSGIKIILIRNRTKLLAEQQINNLLEEADICIINYEFFPKDYTFSSNIIDFLIDLP